jgi:uncharacterized protein YbaR (Trm112 family)
MRQDKNAGNVDEQGSRDYNYNIMKRELMEILACPVCKESLHLAVEEGDGDEVFTGSLYCEKCGYYYPIVDSIPNLLPPEFDSQE